MDSDMVSNHALNYRQDGTSNDGHIQDAGSISGQRAEFRDSQTEDCRKHDRVEQTNSEDGPHREVSAR